MSENQFFVSPDKLSRPEQAEAALCGGIRNTKVYEATRFTLSVLQPSIDYTPAQVEPTPQPVYQPAYQQSQQPAESAASWTAAPVDTEPDFSPAATNAYLDAIASEPTDLQPNTGTNWQQAPSTDEQTLRQEQARQDLASFYGEADSQSNYDLAA